MRQTLTGLFLAGLALALLFYSCEEDIPAPPDKEETQTAENARGEIDFSFLGDSVLRQFFDFGNTPLSQSRDGSSALIDLSVQTYEQFPSTLEAYSEVAQAIYWQEMASPFISDLVAADGYPIWSRSINFPTDSTDLFYLVPFAHLDGDRLESMLLVFRYQGQLHFNYWKRGALKTLVNLDSNHANDKVYVMLTLAADSWTFDNDTGNEMGNLLRALGGRHWEGRCVTSSSFEIVTSAWVCHEYEISRMTCGWEEVSIPVLVLEDCGGGGGSPPGNPGTPPGAGWPSGPGGSGGSHAPQNPTPPGDDGGHNDGNTGPLYVSPIDHFLGVGDGDGRWDLLEKIVNPIPELGSFQFALTSEERGWLLGNLEMLSLLGTFIDASGESLNGTRLKGIYDFIRNLENSHPLIHEYLEQVIDTHDGKFNELILLILEEASNGEYDKSKIEELIDDYIHLNEMEEGLFDVASLQNVPRAEYIAYIVGVKNYLQKRGSSIYGDHIAFLEELLGDLSVTGIYTKKEVYRVAYEVREWKRQLQAIYMIAIFKTFSKAVKPIIEFCLVELSFVIYTQAFNSFVSTASSLASTHTVRALGATTISESTSSIWSRLSNQANSNWSNTLIPETFEITATNGNKYYVQYSATEHMAERVTNAMGTTLYNSQKALRSQLVLDDFAKALDDFLAKNPNFSPHTTYQSGMWEFRFGLPNTGGVTTPHMRIYHAQPISKTIVVE